MPKSLWHLRELNFKIWILATGRLLSQIGTGFTFFYTPIFFVNQVGMSATLVGIALGSGSVSGILGRFFGGSLIDSPAYGRRKTLLFSAAVSAIASVILALTYDFPTLIIANLLMGLGVGLYWPATEAAVADLTTIEQRNEAFAITRLADNLGLSLGVVLGGALIATSGNYRALFIIDGISFVIFFLLIYFTIAETYHFHSHQSLPHEGWKIAISDRRLMIYFLVNILFTTYISQVQSTLPLYLKNFASSGQFSATVISIIFSWHIVCTAVFQLPIARFLNQFSYVNALIFSLLLWGLGFVLVWVTGIITHYTIIWSILALGVLALAIIAYTPVASALVVALSPAELRGVYLSINSQCWAIGYLIGPPLGGWALDQGKILADGFWLGLALSIGLGIWILKILETELKKSAI